MEASKAFVFLGLTEFSCCFFCRCILLSCRGPGGLCDQSDLHISPHRECRICPRFTLIPGPLVLLSGEGPSLWTDSAFWVSSGPFYTRWTLTHAFVLTRIVPRQECVMHVDGAEEDLHDELEDVCSDDGKLLNTQ